MFKEYQILQIIREKEGVSEGKGGGKDWKGRRGKKKR